VVAHEYAVLIARNGAAAKNDDADSCQPRTDAHDPDAGAIEKVRVARNQRPRKCDERGGRRQHSKRAEH